MWRFLVVAVSSVLLASGALAQEAPLVTRNHVKLSQAGVQRILAVAQAKAEAMKLKVNIAVVDDGGHPLGFTRMDGARPASAYTALTKAVASATMRTATGPVPANAEKPDIHLGISLQNAAAASGGTMTTLYGGVPVIVDAQVIGAVGVGGGTGEQDAEIAKAGIAALVEAVEKEGK